MKNKTSSLRFLCLVSATAVAGSMIAALPALRYVDGYRNVTAIDALTDWGCIGLLGLAGFLGLRAIPTRRLLPAALP